VFVLGVQPAPVGAAPATPRRDPKLDTLRAQVAEASAEESSLLGRIDASAARRRSLDGRVAAIDRQIAAVQADLDAAQPRLASQTGRDAVAGRKAALEQSRQQADGLRGQVRAELADQGRALDEIQARRGEFEAQLAALQVTSDHLGELLRARQAGETAPPARRGLFARPVDGPIT